MVGACTATNEEVTLVFPSEDARAPVQAIAATVLEPLVEEANGTSRFVGCERIGGFGPIDELRVAREATGDDVRVLDAQRVPFPFGDDGLTIGFDDFDDRDNPWGVAAVYFEAVGPARVPGSGRGQLREDDATLLSGCYCVRTRAGRHPDPDPDLDAEIRDRCPLIGGREGEPTQRRSVPLRPVPPTEFRLEPCGTDEAAAPSDGRAQPGPSACVRTEPCADTASDLCFECSLECTELDDRSGAPVEFRVVTANAPVSGTRQVVLTDPQGRAAPALDFQGCDRELEVEARVFGRRTEVVTYRVSCVPALDALVARDALPSARSRVVAVAAVPGAGSRSPTLATLEQEVDPQSSLVVSTLELWDGSSGRLLPVSGATWDFDGRTAHGLEAFRVEPGPAGAVWIAVAVATSTDTTSVRNVQVHVFEWDGERLQPVAGTPLSEPCPQCDCGGLSECQSDSTCPPSERCLDGRCRSVAPRACNSSSDCVEPGTICFADTCMASPLVGCSNSAECEVGSVCLSGFCAPSSPCRCELRAAPSDRVVLRGRDLDGDGRADLAVGVGGSLFVTLHRSGTADDPFPARGCSCARLNPVGTTFDVLEIGGDALSSAESPLLDLTLASVDGAHIRYAETLDGGQTGLTCGTAALIGEAFEARDVRAARTRCRADDASCAARDDVLILGTVDFPGAPDTPVLRVIYGDEALITEDRERFDRPGVQSAYFPSQAAGEARARDPRALELGDFNGDGRVDVAILFRGLAEVRVWLGSATGAFTESSRARFGELDEGCVASTDFAPVDLDGDGADELVVVCDPTVSPRYVVFGSAE